MVNHKLISLEEKLITDDGTIKLENNLVAIDKNHSMPLSTMYYSTRNIGVFFKEVNKNYVIVYRFLLI